MEQAQQPPQVAALPPGWVERTDPNSGRAYYANLVTRESRWDRPTATAATPPVVAAAAAPIAVVAAAQIAPATALPPLPCGWEERLDRNSGRTYYVHLPSRKSQWERPRPLADGWEERTDRSSGRVYYVCPATRESRWERPEVLSPAAGATASTTTAVEAKPAAAPVKAAAAEQPQPAMKFIDAPLAESAPPVHAKGPMRGTGESSYRPLKIVTVGDGAVGKTCLLISFTTDAFPPEYVPTVFDNYACNILLDGQRYNLGLWDTAGQEEFDRLRPLSYPQTDIFLMCYSVVSPSSLNNCRIKWMPEISHHCPDARVILVGTKKDLLSDDLTLEQLQQLRQQPVSAEEAAKAACDLGCVSSLVCSAKTREGLEAVFHEAVRVCTAPVKKPKKRQACCVL
eukprot:TRINITY_DN5553_c0_g1_i2.p1 TRINITY_DN5553_c0_g1~~TRINITY_DN5553_c0_g1_i2.p1  ORF type:complete len:398 (+),score=113.06 TRINITY_DN5553_c0_g1_i2:120-1313(+)